MKGKIAIVLLGLALVFGMTAASCDNEGFPKQDLEDATSLVFYKVDNRLLPVDNINNLPEYEDQAVAWKALNQKTVQSPTTKAWVTPKIAGKVGPQPDITYTDTEQAIMSKFSGMPILIPNPAAK